MSIRKIHKIWFLIGISLFISGCPFKSGIEAEAWFQYAEKYDHIWSKMAESRDRTVRDLNKAETIKQQFLQSRQPTEDEIISVLKSPNRRCQRVGLAAMSLKPIETSQLTDILFEFLKDQDRVFRYYAYYALKESKDFPMPRNAALGRQLIEIIKNEKDTVIACSEYLLLAKFPSEEASQFLTEQLVKEGKENIWNRTIGFKALYEMGGSYYEKAAEYVNTHGSPEIKNEFLRNEKFYSTQKEE